MTTIFRQRSIVLLVLLCCIGLTARAHAATWGSAENPAAFQPLNTKSARIDHSGSSVGTVLACGSQWIFTAGFQVFAVSGTTVSNVTPYVNPFGQASQAYPSIACGTGGTALIAYYTSTGNQVWEWNGTSITQVALTNADATFSSTSTVVTLAPQKLGDKNILVALDSTHLWYLENGALAPITISTDVAAVTQSEYALVTAYDQVFQIAGTTAVNITAPIGIKWVRFAQKFGSTWYVGGTPNPDEAQTDTQNSFLKYDGAAWTNLTSSVHGWEVSNVAGSSTLLALINGWLYTYSGSGITPLSILPKPGNVKIGGLSAIGWNGSSWLGGSSIPNDVYLFSPASSTSQKTTVLTDRTLKFSLRYPTVYGRPQYLLGKKTPILMTILPYYKNGSFSYDIRPAFVGNYGGLSAGSAVLKAALKKSWSLYISTFAAQYKKKNTFSNALEKTTVVSVTTQPFAIPGLNAAKVVVISRTEAGFTKPRTKSTSRNEFILISSKDRKKGYTLALEGTSSGSWTVSANPYVGVFEAMAKSFVMLK